MTGTAIKLISDLRKLGFQLHTDGNKITYRYELAGMPPEESAKSLLAELKLHKSDIICCLKNELYFFPATSAPDHLYSNPFKEIFHRACDALGKAYRGYVIDYSDDSQTALDLAIQQSQEEIDKIWFKELAKRPLSVRATADPRSGCGYW